MKLLAADPYYFNNSSYFDKAEQIERDVGYLKSFLNKSTKEVFEASAAYVGREQDLYYFISAMKFWQNAVDVQLTDKSTNLATLVTIFSIEAIMGGRLKGNSERLRNFLINYLSKDEKVELTSGFTFGVPFEMGEGRPRKKHLCHRAVILSREGKLYNRSYCTSGSTPVCFCREWLSTASNRAINKYLNMLAGHFYRMRNSVVHDAGFVRFTSMPYFDDRFGTVVPTTVDAFSNNQKGVYTSYDTDITVQRFHQIMKSGAWRCFTSGTKFRKYKFIEPLVRL